MNEIFGGKFILNGNILPAGQFDNSFVYEGDSVYEVIRMVRGTPVFFNDHLERLNNSAKLIGKQIIAEENVLRRAIVNLARTWKIREVNLKIVFNYNQGAGNFLVYFIEPLYPSETQYINGVKGILFGAERKDPESKIINQKLRSSVYHRLILDGGYEALLVDSQDCITEGSRSNIFFLKDNKLTTAPSDKVLNGITRKYIIDICKINNIPVEYSCVPVRSLPEYDAVFMTGTSPMVLPFCCIGKIKFNPGVPVIEKLRRLYIEKMEESIALFLKGKY